MGKREFFEKSTAIFLLILKLLSGPKIYLEHHLVQLVKVKGTDILVVNSERSHSSDYTHIW